MHHTVTVDLFRLTQNVLYRKNFAGHFVYTKFGTSPKTELWEVMHNLFEFIITCVKFIDNLQLLVHV